MTRHTAAVAAVGLLLMQAPSMAGCGDGPWPLEREAAAFSRPADLPAVNSGARLAVPDFSAVTLALKPVATAGLPASPGRAGDGTGTAGVLRLAIETPGLYQVTVPEAVWLDMIVEGSALSPEAYTPAKDCAGVRKSVRFRLPAGDAILQVSRTQAAHLPLALARIP